MKRLSLPSVKQTSFSHKRVIVRLDFDVPLEKGKVMDDSRVRVAIPTLRFLRKNHARLVIMGHLGRPGGKQVNTKSIRPILRRLEKMLRTRIQFSSQLTGPSVQKKVEKLHPGEILMIENLRFDPGERKNSSTFAKKLSQLGDAYVNESFGNSHRAHASMVGIPKYIPGYAGLRILEEVENLTRLRYHARRPFVAVIGGAKISSKASVIKAMCGFVDTVLVGGALANTLLFAQNHPVGKSLIEKKLESTAKDLLRQRLRIPIDVVTSTSLSGGRRQIKGVGAVEKNDIILDIGPDTVQLYSNIIQKEKTVVWGGPMGYFEDPRFAKGTLEIAKAIGRCKGKTLAGGGETLEAIQKAKVKNQLTYVSMGGGAMLQFLEGRPLPALEALIQSYEKFSN